MINIDDAIIYGKKLEKYKPNIFIELTNFFNNHKQHLTPPREFVRDFAKSFPALKEHLSTKVAVTGTSKNLKAQDIYYLIKHKRQICTECKNPTNYLAVGYRELLRCSKVCANISPDVWKIRRATTLAKYGTENIFASNKFKKALPSIMLNKYGVTNASKSDIIQKRKVDTAIRMRGVTHHSKQEEFRSIMKINNPMFKKDAKNNLIRTNMQKYGTPCVFMNERIKEKLIEISLRNYGTENPAQSELVKAKIRKSMEKWEGGWSSRDPMIQAKSMNTTIDRYGVFYPMQDPDIFDRVNAHSHKIYVSKTGKEIKCKGYEPKVLAYLERTDNVAGIKVRANKLPEIYYEHNDKQHRYYMDMMVHTKTNNWYGVEVKSTWTLINELERNLAKFKAANKYARRNKQIFLLAVPAEKSDSIVWIKFPTLGKIRKFYRTHCNKII